MEYFLISDTTCRSNILGSNKKCLIKDEVGPLSSRMIGGNPCFQAIKKEGVIFHNYKLDENATFFCKMHNGCLTTEIYKMNSLQICFVSKDGQLETCSCSNKNCGCQDVVDKKPQPKITQSTSSQKTGVQKHKDTKPIASGTSTYT